MKKFHIFCYIILLFSVSCTIPKTDFKERLDINKRGALEQGGAVKKDNINIIFEAPGGEFLRGYNEFAIKFEVPNNEKIEEVTFFPTYKDENGKIFSSPHSYQLVQTEKTNYFKGFVVFNLPKQYSVLNNTHSGIRTFWNGHISYKVNGEKKEFDTMLEVLDTRNANLNMTEFVGKDGITYYIALIAPEIPDVAINDLVAGIWKWNPTDNSVPEIINNQPNPAKFSYSVVNNYLLELDPRMPGEDMGNHSSPHNEDLTQKEDGFYYGKVNYTMYGYWTLNFILKNESQQVIKGTTVSKKMTIGQFGEQSELHIDILF